MDSRLKSFSEALTNILPGFLAAYFATFVILPPFSKGIESSDPTTMLVIAVFFTGVSVSRMYLLRRIFARLGEDENLYTLVRRIIHKARNATL